MAPTRIGNPGLVVAIELNGANGYTGALTVTHGPNVGRLLFHQGQLVDAEAGGAVGEEAVRQVVGWPASEYALHPEEAPTRRTISRPLEAIVAELRGQPVRSAPSAASPRPPAPPPARAAPPAPPAAPASPAPARPPPASEPPATVAPARRPASGSSMKTLIALGAGAVAVLIAIAVYAVVAKPPHGPVAPVAPRAAAEVVVRIGGGKTFAAELAPNLAKAYLESLRATNVTASKDPSGRTTVSGGLEGGAVAITVEGMATAKGFEELAADRLDVAMAGRRIKPDWQKKLDAFGTMTAPGFEHVVGISGIAVIVHPSNPVAKLDRQKLAAVFSGEATEWSALGGPRSAIHVYAGDDQMGMTDLFRTLVLGKAEYAPDAKRLATILAVNDAVAQDPAGIGYVTLPFVRGTRAVPVAEGSEPPHLPTPFTLATEDYFLTHRCFFYAVPKPQRPHLLKFLQFALGAEGQAVVKRSGFVELAVATAGDAVPAWAPADYRRLVGKAKKLTSTLRFETDSATFDTRALADLERVSAWLMENRLSGGAVKVLGFTDARGKADRNVELSLARADQVRQAFAQRGIDGVAVAGFGPAMPVASNETEEGRQRNRRVEIWVER